MSCNFSLLTDVVFLFRTASNKDHVPGGFELPVPRSPWGPIWSISHPFCRSFNELLKHQSTLNALMPIDKLVFGLCRKRDNSVNKSNCLLTYVRSK